MSVRQIQARWVRQNGLRKNKIHRWKTVRTKPNQQTCSEITALMYARYSDVFVYTSGPPAKAMHKPATGKHKQVTGRNCLHHPRRRPCNQATSSTQRNPAKARLTVNRCRPEKDCPGRTRKVMQGNKMMATRDNHQHNQQKCDKNLVLSG